MKNSISSSSFSKIFNNSRLISCDKILFRVYRGPELKSSLVSFAINKKLGHAHERNLFKRRMRALFKNCFVENNDKIAMIIIPKSINLGWNNMRNSFELLKKKYND